MWVHEPRCIAALAAVCICALNAGCAEPGAAATVGPAPDGGAVAAERPRVRTRAGELEGERVGANVRFLGIPYAEPPLGRLRFRRPEPHGGFTGVRDASRFGPRCPQLPASTPEGDTEDCLLLNVWTSAQTTGDKLPVMVWIHGGGHVAGSASDGGGADSPALFSGEHLSALHGVVVVTLNYRLGALGFLAHDASAGEGEAPGNYGLWDQRLALAWVQEEIAKFGGDPDNVTIFGESAGSVDVCLHVASPHSRGLFQRAISQSGACTTRRRELLEGAEQARALASALGCAESDALACLRAKPVTELLDAAAGNGPFGPIMDGDFVPEQPRALFDRGEIADVPYLIGCTHNEGAGFVLDALDVTEASYLSELAERFPPPVEEIAQTYPASAFAGAANPHFAALARALGDSRFVCSAQDTALRAVAAGLSVFMYDFNVPLDGPDGVLGATHGSELGYVFGTWPLTPEMQGVSERIHGYWSEFARSGDPNGGERPHWPAFTAEADVRIELGLAPGLVSDFRAAECAFWRRRYDAAFTSPPP